MFESLLFRPNFPSAPQRTFDFYTFPNDLIVGDRNYYTEIQFYSYDSGFMFPEYAPQEDTPPQEGESWFTSLANRITPDFLKSSSYRGGEFAIGQGKAGVALGNMKLPLPQKINDTLTFSWGEGSVTEVASNIIQNLSLVNQLANFTTNAAQLLIQGGGVISGYAINPMMFQQFQRPNFREFNFQWTLAPRTRTESATIASMITLLKRAASPRKTAGTAGLILGYPLVAQIKFWPNNLSGHPSEQIGGMIMKPCIIQGISVDYTPLGPTFFKGTEGAPVIVSINVSVKELQLWYREDFYTQNQSPTG